METKIYAVNLERLFFIHQKIRKLEEIVNEIKSLADDCRGRFHVYYPVINRFEKLRVFLDNFDNSNDPNGVANASFEFEVSDVIDLANAFNKHLIITKQLDELGDEVYMRDCQTLRMLYEKFYKILSSLRVG